VEVGRARHRNGEGAKRGDLTGRNPTDRGKRGVKRHILTDAHGVPLAAIITGANVFDGKMLEATLDATVLRGPRGPRRPQHLCLDKAYDSRATRRALRKRCIRGHVRRWCEPPLEGAFRGKARRWVVERTNSWHNRFRGLLVRWERIGSHYLGLLHLACAIIAMRAAAGY
jgi:transposase